MKNTFQNQYITQTFLSFSVDQLHKETQDWISELEFIRIEQNFLVQLITEHIFAICNDEAYKNIKFYLTGIKNEQKLGLQLFNSIKEHKINLALLIEHIYLKREDSFRKDHKLLELELKNYVQNFKYIKEEVFELILNCLTNYKKIYKTK